MKIRLCFVSNSSSASFVVTWKFYENSNHKNLSIKEVLLQLFQICYDKEEDKIKISKYETDTDRLEIIEKLEKATVGLTNNIYETNFFTGMLSYPEDFGKECQSLIFNLIMNDNFEIVRKKVEEDV